MSCMDKKITAAFLAVVMVFAMAIVPVRAVLASMLPVVDMTHDMVQMHDHMGHDSAAMHCKSPDCTVSPGNMTDTCAEMGHGHCSSCAIVLGDNRIPVFSLAHTGLVPIRHVASPGRQAPPPLRPPRV